MCVEQNRGYRLSTIKKLHSVTPATPSIMSFVLTDPDKCIITSHDGMVFQEPSCMFPFMEYFYFKYVSLPWMECNQPEFQWNISHLIFSVYFTAFHSNTLLSLIVSNEHSWEKYHKCDQYSCYDFIPMKNFLDSNPVIPYVAVSMYALFCYYGKKYFAKRDPWNLRNTMVRILNTKNTGWGLLKQGLYFIGVSRVIIDEFVLRIKHL